MNAAIVGNLFLLSPNSRCISEFTQERNPIYVPNVGRPSPIGQISILTRSLIPERSLTYVLNVGRPSQTGQISINTRPFILEINPISAVTVERVSPRNQFLVCIAIFIHEITLFLKNKRALP